MKKKSFAKQLGAKYHLRELLSGFCRALAVIRVNHKDEALRVLEVVTPQRPGTRKENTVGFRAKNKTGGEKKEGTRC